VLRRLAISASDCVAIEDSRNGLLAASLASVPVVITRSVYFDDEDFSEALVSVADLAELSSEAMAANPINGAVEGKNRPPGRASA